MINRLIDQEKLMKAIDNMDAQSQDLTCQIIDHFESKFSNDENVALSLFLTCLDHSEDPNINRNRIFKSANLLKIKLPSYSF